MTNGFQTTMESVSPPLSAIRFFPTSKDFVGGATLEVRINQHWSVEADALFRQLSMTWAAVLPDGTLNSVSPSPVVTWQVPVLAKYRFSLGRVRPFVEAGPSFRIAGNLNGTDPSHLGITGGSGIEIPWRRFKIAPVVRYTRWAADDRDYGARTAANQVELLVGFSRESESDWHPWGQRVSVGVLLGTNLTPDIRNLRQDRQGPVPGPPNFPAAILESSGARRLLLGPTVEVRLVDRISLEGDALYRPITRDTELIYPDGRSEQNSFTSAM